MTDAIGASPRSFIFLPRLAAPEHSSISLITRALGSQTLRTPNSVCNLLMRPTPPPKQKQRLHRRERHSFSAFCRVAGGDRSVDPVTGRAEEDRRKAKDQRSPFERKVELQAPRGTSADADASQCSVRNARKGSVRSVRCRPRRRSETETGMGSAAEGFPDPGSKHVKPKVQDVINCMSRKVAL